MATLQTPTIVRIKRRLGSESSESIIVSTTKRKRLNEDEVTDNTIPDICTAIFKKLTTLKQGDSLEIETRKALEKEPKHSWDIKENYKKGFSSTSKELVQKKTKSDVAAIRFKLVCSKRHRGEEKDAIDTPFNLLDALKDKEDTAVAPVPSSSKEKDLDVITCNGIPLESEKVEFVYDLYYTSLPLEVSSWIDNICEIQTYNAIDYRDPKEKDDDESEDSDDENSESNWRNDYPDEEDAEYFVDEDDKLCSALQNKAKIYDTDESYDDADYDESGDFDNEGNLILYSNPESVFYFDRFRKPNTDDTSSEESEED